MNLAVSKEGLLAPLFFIPVVLLAAGNVAAQTVAPQDLQRCAALETDELKLECFESLAAPDTEPVDALEETNSTPTPAAIAVAPAAVAVGEGGAADIQGSIDDANAAEPAPAAEPTSELSSTPVSEAPRTEPVVAAAPDDLGDEHLQPVETKEAEPESYFATVDKVTREYDRRLTFYFTNGQVWRQVASDYLQYPKGKTFDVEISQGMMGDYQIRVGGEGRMTRISRIK